MSELTLSDKIAVRSAGARGRGVFATRALAQGELVEEVVVLVLSAGEAAAARAGGGALEEYLFSWDPEDPARTFAVGTGFSPFYNHAATPNVTLRRDLAARVLRFVALRDVAPGEELRFDYDCELWFDPA